MKLRSFLTAAFAAQGAVAASIRIRQSLEDCVAQALTYADAAKRIVTPQDETYTDARLGEKIQFEEFPALIAYVTDAKEVAPLVKCAQAAGIKAVPRSGGHHFEAYSSLNNTLVIDLGHLNYVEVSEDQKTAKVGAGIRLGALYTALDAYDTSFVGGICPTVGLGGLLSAGGFNMQMRALGVSADYVQSAEVVTADGKLLTASPSSNPDLFWAIRGGGGGTYGIVAEYTLVLKQLPKSSMVAISWNDTEVRFDVAKRFFEWGPTAPKELTSQVNVYKSAVQVLGWHLGGTREELQALVDASGLLDIGEPELQIASDCSTDESRLFGYTTFECATGTPVDASILNVVPEAFSQYGDAPQFAFDEIPKSSEREQAEPWARYLRLSKSFFVQKDNLLSDEVLKGVVDRIGQLDEASQIWGEWHAWNISAEGDNAFAWREEAYSHLEFQIHGSNDTETQAGYEKWFDELEGYLRPAVGPASYAGYIDSKISTDPLESYYGDSLNKLKEIKTKYDPDNFFSNPSAITPNA